MPTDFTSTSNVNKTASAPTRRLSQKPRKIRKQMRRGRRGGRRY